jgi:hypothetical protein
MRHIRPVLLVVVLLCACSSGAHAAPTPTTTERGTLVVPTVVGLRVCDALPVLIKAGLTPEATIASKIDWIVGSQSPVAGDRVVRNATETLSLNRPADSGPPLSRICQEAVSVSRNNG